ncbi:MAG: ABC transporter permease [Deltaproteobacteria bacterium]|nr:ABC transporter permease [Deltaproteobacteria bacterium]
MSDRSLQNSSREKGSRPRVKKARPTPLEYTRKKWFQLVMLLNFIFLYFPIVALVAFSFNNSRRNITWRGFTFKYYVKAFHNDSLFDAFLNSLIVAGISTAVSTLLGAMLGLALYRFKFPGKNAFDGWIHLPIIIPEICMGVAMLAFFSRLHIDLGLFTITVSHIAFSLPFVAVVVRARMAGFDQSLEEAARDLGANQWQTFRDVTLPYMMPGIVAGALLALTLSLDDFVITFFTSGPGSTTLPIKIFSMVRFSVTPEVNAASSVLIAMTLLLTVVTMVLQARGGKNKGLPV